MSNKYHNRGQKDASDGKYSPPVGVGEDLRTWTSSANRENREKNESYRAGHRNARSQK